MRIRRKKVISARPYASQLSNSSEPRCQLVKVVKRQTSDGSQGPGAQSNPSLEKNRAQRTRHAGARWDRTRAPCLSTWGEFAPHKGFGVPICPCRRKIGKPKRSGGRLGSGMEGREPWEKVNNGQEKCKRDKERVMCQKEALRATDGPPLAPGRREEKREKETSREVQRKPSLKTQLPVERYIRGREKGSELTQGRQN